ncbi:hypothetical protein CRUP_033396 [Coryphaenoides rupestris]|nr:hypothetical protein CRUP_033396 [Coryphaenoides rupestris]
MSMDQWPALPPNPPNFSIPEPLVWNVSDLDLLNISDRRDSHQDKTSSMVITFIYFVVCAVGLCGNSLVIYVILRYAKMKTVTNIYILNLAVADVLCMMSLPFISMQLALVHWPFGEALCRAIMTVDALNQFTSIFCLTVMSIDRYLAVVHPIKSTKWRKPRIAKLINLTVWGVSLLVNLPTMIFSGLDKVPVCGMVWPEPQEVYYKAFMFYTFFIGFFLPLVVICLCYLLIIVKVKLIWHAGGLQQACANPILYAFLSDNFKKSFQNVLCLKKVAGLDEMERSDSSGGPQPDGARHHGQTTPTWRPTNAALLNGELQTAI